MAAPPGQPVHMRLAHRWVGPLVARYLRVEVSGAEHVPAEGGVALAANHRSFLDHYLLAAVSPRPVRFLGKVELSRGLLGRFNLAFGMVPVKRGTADLGAIGAIARYLEEGEVVVIFPEGTRSPDGSLYRFRSGLARVTAQAGMPCVPVGLVGTAEYWPRGGRPPLRPPAQAAIKVRFGEPIAAPADDGASRRAFTHAVHASVAALCGQPLADGYAPIVRTPAAQLDLR
jgi:1-acyl-sn-glycerol-3-phosphate acyltransferase